MNMGRDMRKVCDELKELGLDGLLLSPSADLAYLTGQEILSLERPVVFLVLDGKSIFLLPEFELTGLKRAEQENVIYVGWREQEDPYKKLVGIVGDQKRKVAVEPEMPVKMFFKLQKAFPEWEWVPDEQIMRSMRMRKTEREHMLLKEAHIRSGRAFERLLKEKLEGKTEKQTALLLRNYLEEEGLECDGIPLVAAGRNTAKPHHRATDAVIGKEDPVLFDFGGRYQGYYSDITRTVVVGKAPDGFEEIYDIVRRANEEACRYARPGIAAEDLDWKARSVIDKAGYGDYFTHRLGHGTGRDIHEDPFIVMGNKVQLEEGNVFSDEPGIYIPGRYGVRLEDALFLKKDGAECLTELTHELLVVE